MKNIPFALPLTLFLLALAPHLPGDDDYTFFIRQIQLQDAGELEWDMDVEQQGTDQSALPINPHGARFELYTVKSSPLTSFLLDTT